MLFISIQANDAQLRGPLALLIVTVKAPHLDFTERSDSICQVDTLIVNLIVLRDYALSERTVFCTCAATLPNFLLVYSVLLYGSESWAISDTQIKRLEGILRDMLRQALPPRMRPRLFDDVGAVCYFCSARRHSAL